MGLALDEPTDNDEKVQDGELTFLVEKSLSKYLPEVKVDYQDSWFGKTVCRTISWRFRLLKRPNKGFLTPKRARKPLF